VLLVGNPQQSFLWDRPLIFLTPFSIGRGHRKLRLDEFLHSLEMGASA
jgi:hypothetical protein